MAQRSWLVGERKRSGHVLLTCLLGNNLDWCSSYILLEALDQSAFGSPAHLAGLSPSSKITFPRKEETWFDMHSCELRPTPQLIGFMDSLD